MGIGRGKREIMKKIVIWTMAIAVAALATVGLATPAFAAPVTSSNVATIGGANFVSTSADGTITAAYSADTGLSVYNSTTDQVSSYTAIFLGMTHVGEAVVSPDGTEIYILGDNPQAVAVFNVSSETVTRTIALPFSAWMGAITPDGSTLLVYAKTTQEILKIDLGSDTVSTPLNLGLDYPYQLCVTSNGSTVYVPGYDAGYTSIVDIGSLTQTGTLPDTDQPLNCVLGADDTLFIGDYATGAVRKYAADGSNIVSAAGLAEEMYGMGLTCNSVIVGDYQNTGYAVLDRTTLEQTGSIASEVYTYMMTVTADAKTTWVGGYYAAQGLQSITEDNCPVAAPTLPNTGISSQGAFMMTGIASLALALGAGLIMHRRRKNS